MSALHAKRFAACAGALALASSALTAENVDRSVQLGPFTADMSFDEIERIAGTKGERSCETWPPNPTVHYCTLKIVTADYWLEVEKGGDGQTLDMDRRVPVPNDMPVGAIMKQVNEKYARFGVPTKFGDGYNWGCPDGECGKGTMIRASVIDGIYGILGQRRHLSIVWRDWDATENNHKRFFQESNAWKERQKADEAAYPKLKL